MRSPRAFIQRVGWPGPDGGLIRLLAMDERGAVLLGDGTWLTVPDNGLYPEKAGILLPASVIEPLAVAIQEFQGHTSHADTEARILREWLAIEQRRVDAVLVREANR
jgi:hypothetical protein